MIYFSVLFGVEVVMPWVLVILGHPGDMAVGDANTKAVLTNLVIAIMSYIVGRNEGSRQAEQNIAKLVDTAKTVADTAATTVHNAVGSASGDIKLKEGDNLNVEAVPATPPEEK